MIIRLLSIYKSNKFKCRKFSKTGIIIMVKLNIWLVFQFLVRLLYLPVIFFDYEWISFTNISSYTRQITKSWRNLPQLRALYIVQLPDFAVKIAACQTMLCCVSVFTHHIRWTTMPNILKWSKFTRSDDKNTSQSR